MPILLDLDMDDIADELKRLRLPKQLALATFLKANYGMWVTGMIDEEWLEEAKDILEILAVSTGQDATTPNGGNRTLPICEECHKNAAAFLINGEWKCSACRWRPVVRGEVAS